MSSARGRVQTRARLTKEPAPPQVAAVGEGETTVMREDGSAAQGETVMRGEGEELDAAGETSDERGTAAIPATAGQG